MSGERSSTVRKIRSGRICASCRRPLTQPTTSGEQLCSGCRAASGRHRIYMSFVHRQVWHCSFLEDDLKTPLRKKLSFTSAEKIREIARRGGCTLNLETLQALDHGIENGRGGMWLELTAEQYGKLCSP